MLLDATLANRQCLSLRIEWNGIGPFWCGKTNRLLERLCRQATPDWKSFDDASSFLHHYVTHAPSPYDHPAFDWHLSRRSAEDPSLAFGFVSKDSMLEQLGLANERYQRQFTALLSRPEFALRIYLAPALAASSTEVLYRRTDAQLLDECKTWEQLRAL